MNFSTGNALHPAVAAGIARVTMISSLTREQTEFLAKHFPVRFDCRHVELTYLLSLDDEPHQPSPWLMDLFTEVLKAARSIDLSPLYPRLKPGMRNYWACWPGDHYRLLAAVVQVLQPRQVLEVGTANGMGTLALAHTLPAGATLHTYDILPWNRFEDTLFTAADFESGRICQHLDDLAQPENCMRHLPRLRDSTLLFLDGPKDIQFEERLLGFLEHIPFTQRPLIFLDDIRLMNMVHIWRGIQRPKLDLTSFGHWSGTGWIDWCPQ